MTDNQRRALHYIATRKAPVTDDVAELRALIADLQMTARMVLQNVPLASTEGACLGM